MNTPLLTGPIASRMDGADLSSLVGTVVVATLYAVISLQQHQSRAAAVPAGQTKGANAGTARQQMADPPSAAAA